MKYLVTFFMMCSAAMASDLGTGANQAYPGDAGASVSNTAAGAVQADGTTPMTGTFNAGGKAITNADYIAVTNLTAYSTAGARPFWVADADGRLYPTAHNMEVADRSITILTTDTIQDEIDAIGKYLPHGVDITVTFEDGTHTPADTIDLTGFHGGGTLTLKSTETDTTTHTDQPAIIDADSITASAFRIIRCNCSITIQNLAIRVDGASSYRGIMAEYCSGSVMVYYNYIYSDVNAVAYGVSSRYGSYIFSRNNTMSGMAKALLAVYGSALVSRGDIKGGTANTYGYTSYGSRVHQYEQALLGPTNVAYGGIFVAPGGAILP